MNDLPRQKLREIVELYGRSICDNPQHCKGLLLDLCGEQKREVNILIAVLEEHTVSELMHSSASIPTEILLARLTQRMCDNRSMEKEAARWGVESWALALGMSIHEARTTPTIRPQPEQLTEMPASTLLSPRSQEVASSPHSPAPSEQLKETSLSHKSVLSPEQAPSVQSRVQQEGVDLHRLPLEQVPKSPSPSWSRRIFALLSMVLLALPTAGLLKLTIGSAADANAAIWMGLGFLLVLPFIAGIVLAAISGTYETALGCIGGIVYGLAFLIIGVLILGTTPSFSFSLVPIFVPLWFGFLSLMGAAIYSSIKDMRKGTRS